MVINVTSMNSPLNLEAKTEQSGLLLHVWLSQLPLSLPDEHLLLSRG